MPSSLSFRPLAPFVCPRCSTQLNFRGKPRRVISTATSRAAPVENTSLDSSSPRLEFVPPTWLSSRSVIKLEGPDTVPFLQGLITANVSRLASRPFYTAFLNAQGRVLQDVFIYPPANTSEGVSTKASDVGTEGLTTNPSSASNSWFIEVDSKSAPALVAHLKKHKLRSKLKIKYLDLGKAGNDSEVLAVFYRSQGQNGMMPSGRSQSEVQGGQDQRSGMGMRWLAKPVPAFDIRETDKDLASTDERSGMTPQQKYQIHRILNGIAEGQDEIISSSALPQESNIDLLGGIDFHKGCYLGQELTIRTHHTGVVRKRILPAQIYDSDLTDPKEALEPVYIPDSSLPIPPVGANISKLSSRKGRSAGKWLGGVGNVGLALCRLEMMTDIKLTDEPTQFSPDQVFKVSWDAEQGGTEGEVKVKVFVPQWMREGITSRMKRRERKSPREDVEEDEQMA